MTLTVSTITFDEGHEILNHILDIAKNDGLNPVAICIVDASSDQVCAATMTGTKAPSIATAHAKAVTAVRFATDTIAMNDPNDGWSANDVAQAMKINPIFCSWGGGVLILSPHDNSILGAVGVSNRSEVEDDDLASQRPSGWSA